MTLFTSAKTSVFGREKTQTSLRENKYTLTTTVITPRRSKFFTDFLPRNILLWYFSEQTLHFRGNNEQIKYKSSDTQQQLLL